MTTIAYRNGQMAAERHLTLNENTVTTSPIPKIARDSNGVLYGVSGDWPGCCAVLEAVKLQAQTGKPVEIPMPTKDKDYIILVAFPDGRLRVLSMHGEDNFDGAPYHAIGGGTEAALGAMYAGASAQLAVEAACAHHIASTGPVDFLYHPAEARRIDAMTPIRTGPYPDLLNDDELSDHALVAVQRVYQEMAEVPVKLDQTSDGITRATMIDSAEKEFEAIANAKG